MKYSKSIAIAAFIYLALMDFAWDMYKVVLPIWLVVFITPFIAVIIYFLDLRYKKKQEDNELELGTRQVEIESRRLDAEDFILKSGDEEANNFLNRARANPRSYVRILSEGMEKGNATVRVALGIMAGLFENNVLQVVDDETLAKALDNMASELVGTVFKKDSSHVHSNQEKIRRHF